MLTKRRCKKCGKEFIPAGAGNWAFCSIICRREFHIPSLAKKRAAPRFTEHLNCAFTKDQLIWIREQAAKNAMSLTGYLRLLIDKDILEKGGI